MLWQSTAVQHQLLRVMPVQVAGAQLQAIQKTSRYTNEPGTVEDQAEVAGCRRSPLTASAHPCGNHPCVRRTTRAGRQDCRFLGYFHRINSRGTEGITGLCRVRLCHPELHQRSRCLGSGSGFCHENQLHRDSGHLFRSVCGFRTCGCQRGDCGDYITAAGAFSRWRRNENNGGCRVVDRGGFLKQSENSVSITPVLLRWIMVNLIGFFRELVFVSKEVNAVVKRMTGVAIFATMISNFLSLVIASNTGACQWHEKKLKIIVARSAVRD